MEAECHRLTGTAGLDAGRLQCFTTSGGRVSARINPSALGTGEAAIA